ncbi:hypothetical protein [Paenibacillus sp. TH7-28]
MIKNRSPFKASQKINEYFIKKLGLAVKRVDDLEYRPFLLELNKPLPLKARVYLFNCGNPPGGRPINEYKLVLNVDQKEKHETGNFDFSGGFYAMIIGYIQEYDVFVFWDATKHKNFGRNKNLQVKTDTVIHSLLVPFETQTRNTKNGTEIVIVARSDYLVDAINERMRIFYYELLEG